ncbi:hypothetical protein Lgee_1441 [Legionella geestiana]|uniref:Uncharacterized protein n=2 Tax=Legionella geestiana TaxID=45065 RepID=A0A0W0TTR0_9GAMM|nr:hypothetical protein Lgee_1441 [Legionella geestiana]STX54782.1 Uncharacterised protein [Legionella geestiana]
MRSRSEISPTHSLTFNDIQSEYDALMGACAPAQPGSDESSEQVHRKKMLSELRGTYARYQYNEALEGLQKLSTFAQHNSNERLSPEFMQHFARFKEAATAIDKGNPMTPPAFKMLPHDTAFHANNKAVFVELRKMQAFYERFCKPVEPLTAPTAEQVYWSRLVRISKRPAVETDFSQIIRRIKHILEPGAHARLSDTMIHSFIDHFNRSASVLNEMLGYKAEPSHTPLQTRRKPQTFVDVNEYLRAQEQVRAASRTRSFLPWLKKAWYDAMLPLASEQTRERPDFKHYLFGYTGYQAERGGFFSDLRMLAKGALVFPAVLIKRVPRFIFSNLPAELFNYFKGAQTPDTESRGFSLMSIPETLFRGLGLLIDAAISPYVFFNRVMKFMHDKEVPFLGRRDMQWMFALNMAVLYIAASGALLLLTSLPIVALGMIASLLTDVPLVRFVDEYDSFEPAHQEINRFMAGCFTEDAEVEPETNPGLRLTTEPDHYPSPQNQGGSTVSESQAPEYPAVQPTLE